MIWELDGIAPRIAANAWVAPDAQVIGDVALEEEASVWWGAVLRGDGEGIRVGRGSNIQDLCVLHTDPGCPLTVGANCTVGHRAILHGCAIGDGVLVGMGATILNGARIGTGALIGAGALIAENKEIPPGALVVGAPGKVVRMLDQAGRDMLLQSAARYRVNAARFRAGLRQAGG
ncbi:gamma carbonic anhydrase family protein [Paracoccus sediminis]|uniref:Carbonic anhydrase or acetyltransferase, isoleucine patch superfamily n=1 Tax=Paracoccus sediminis TaxID=1214787 RepID=A0A238UVJ5_9RHOB|nr:gamma carbonic anhydrase family protein [Paracoccus sediminis]TBN52797.1 gamma carbonic anhydrase family protein [Paracoccus sediminis]SNR25757.1 Carbonic anhydrase or acetyltransferase, isoleucine patch superfamily [Paracoccus sediminis]